MPRALLYTRVSTDEQADRGYSLRDQEARLRQYCQREGIDVAAHYQDDHSAKTFERPAWRELLARIEAAPHTVDQVLVVKWDRFSRNATDALSMIRTLDDLGVRVQAVEQPIDSIDEVPEQLLMLSFYVAAPEVENRRRSIATKAGMRRAMREGRYCNVPPKGYRRGYDADDRYLIEPGDDAPYVREAFRLAAETELPINEIARRLRGEGFRCSKNQMNRLLKNPLYAGRIVIPAWRGEPADEVEGAHEPLVDAQTFRRVQERFGPKPKRYHKIKPELPLRGHLRDPETRDLLTGSGSRSRAGHRVWYYHGIGKGATRFRADEAHEAWEEHLDAVRMPHEIAVAFRALAEDELQSDAATRTRRLRAARERIAEAEAKLLAIDERFHVEGAMEADSYARLKKKISSEQAAARGALDELEQRGSGVLERLAFVLDLFEDLPGLWRRADPEARDALVGSIWPAGLVYAAGDFRTTPRSEIIALLAPGSHEMQDARPSKEASVLSGSPEDTAFEPGWGPSNLLIATRDPRILRAAPVLRPFLRAA